MSTLQGNFISKTYQGILHGDGALPGSDKTIIYDGSGNASALSLGQSPNGASVSGQLSAQNLRVGGLDYPTSPSTTGSVVVQTSTNALALTSTLPSTILQNSGVVAGEYRGFTKMTVTPSGIISSITPPDNVKVATAIKFKKNPQEYQYTDLYLPQSIDDPDDPNDVPTNWITVEITADPSLASYVMRGAVIYMERLDDDTLDKDNWVNIWASRRIFADPSFPDDEDVYDLWGNHCFKADSGTRLGNQFITAIRPEDYNPTTGVTENNRYRFLLRDTGPTNSHWKLAVIAFIY